MTAKDALILLIITIIGVTIANLIAIFIAAKQVQGQLQGNSTLTLLTSLLGSTPATATPAS